MSALPSAGEVKTQLDQSIHYSDSSDSLYGVRVRYQKLQSFVPPNLSLNSTAQQEFQLPPSQVYNLSKCRLEYDVVSIASAGYYSVFNMGFWPHLDSIRLYSGSGKELCNITDIPYVTKMLMPMCTPLQKMLSEADAVPGAQTTAVVYGKHHVMYRSDASLVSAQDAFGARIVGTLDGTAWDTSSSDNYTGISNYCIGQQGLPQALRVSVDLGSVLPLSVFSIDKWLYTGETYRLVLNWSPSTAWGFQTPQKDTLVGARPFQQPVQISNAVFQCAICDDEVLAQRIRDKTMSEGVVVNMPQLYVERISTNTVGHFIQTRKFNSGHGKNLLRVFCAVFNGTPTPSANFQNYNQQGVLHTTFRSMLNQRYQQPGDLQINDADHWLYLRDKLEGSAIQALTDLNIRNVFVDDWTPLKSCEWNKSNKQAGLSLAQEQEYGFDISLTTNSSYVVIVANTQRPLRLGASGTEFI